MQLQQLRNEQNCVAERGVSAAEATDATSDGYVQKNHA